MAAEGGAPVVGETIEEMGALEADVGTRFDRQLSSIDPRLQARCDPLAARPLRAEMMLIRQELRQAKEQTLTVRRMALRDLLRRDFIIEDCELRNMGLAYTPTDV